MKNKILSYLVSYLLSIVSGLIIFIFLGMIINPQEGFSVFLILLFTAYLIIHLARFFFKLCLNNKKFLYVGLLITVILIMLVGYTFFYPQPYYDFISSH